MRSLISHVMQGAREDIEILVNAPVKDGGTRIVRGFGICSARWPRKRKSAVKRPGVHFA